MIRNLLPFLLLLFVFGCELKLKEHKFPSPVDTSDKTIATQEKNTYVISNHLIIDNEFDGARFNDLKIKNDSTVSLTTKPENEPINSSPWYALRVVSNDSSSISTLTIDIEYDEAHKHRYWPNMSFDRTNWTRMDSTQVQIATDTLTTSIKLDLTADTIWVAAQPIVSSSDVYAWCERLAKETNVSYETAGESLHGKSLPYLRIGNGSKAIIILSRQHPPEVTGFFALQFFLDEILNHSLSEPFLGEHSLLVYPLMNPDGVDLGHWRHNAAGVDLNRDWAYYRQPEVRNVANHVINTLNKHTLVPVLGLDFHSTWYDIYYTTDRTIATSNQSFTDDWFAYIEANIEGYKVKDAPSALRAPVSKGWFVSQLNIPGITYEIGDNTPLEFNRKKSAVAAEGMMKVLMK